MNNPFTKTRVYMPEPSDKVFDTFTNFLKRTMKWMDNSDNLLLIGFLTITAWLIGELSFAHFIVGIAFSFIFIIYPIFYLLKDRNKQ